MLPLLIPVLTPIVDKLLGLIPDENERQRAKEDLERQMAAAANQAMSDQTDINKIEAASSNVFVAGWRPFIGWVCGAGLAWTFVAQPIAVWVIAAFNVKMATLPVIPTDGLLELILAMLGLGGLRTFEKLRGVAR